MCRGTLLLCCWLAIKNKVLPKQNTNDGTFAETDATEFLLPYFVHKENEYFYVYPKKQWKEIKVVFLNLQIEISRLVLKVKL